jgi:hypothetical protein
MEDLSSFLENFSREMKRKTLNAFWNCDRPKQIVSSFFLKALHATVENPLQAEGAQQSFEKTKISYIKQ